MAHDAPQHLFLTVAPRTESPRLHSRDVLPSGEGWYEALSSLLKIQRIDKAGSPSRRWRRLGRGEGAKLIAAKLCAPLALPYLLSAGSARSTAGADALDQWGWLPLDLDKVGVSVEELLRLIDAAFGDVRFVSWTTWSCADGRASARVFIPLSRLARYSEVCTLWWWARRRLLAAGLPETAYDGVEPSIDPRLDSRGYFLPAAPASLVVGEEGWGGTLPRGSISEDCDPILDVDAFLPEAHLAQRADSAAVAARWPSLHLPGGKAAGVKTRSSRLPVAQDAGTGKAGKSGASLRVDFGDVAFEGTTLRAWALEHVRPGSYASVDTPWREDECWGARGTALALHVETNGRVWAKDFRSGITYRDVSGAFTRAPALVVAKGKGAAPGAHPLPRRAGVKARSMRCPTTGETLEARGRLKTRDDGGWRLQVARDDLIRQKYLDAHRLTVLLHLEIEALKAAGLPAPTLKSLTCTVWKAGQGRGKTHAARVFVERAHQKKERVVAVSPTRSLSRDSARRYGLSCYLDESPTGYLEGSVATCSQSLYRVPHFQCRDGQLSFQADGADLLILDEVEQIAASWGGQHLRDGEARGAYEAACRHLGVAKSAMLLDADAGQLTERLIRASGRDLSSVLWIEAPPAEARKLRRAPQYAEALAEAIREAGEHRIAVAAQSVDEVETLARLLPRWGGLPTLVLSSENADRYDLGELDSLLRSHGHVVYTPVLGTGVSIDLIGHFHRVYAFLHDGVGTATTALQLLSRVRFPVETEVVVARLPSGGAREPAPWESDSREVAARWYRRESATLRAVGFQRDLPADLCVVVGGGELQVDKRVAAYVELMAAAHAQSVREGRGRVTEALCDLCESIGWEVDRGDGVIAPLSDEAKAAYAERKGTKAQVVEAQVQAVVKAADLDVKVLEKARRSGAQTRPEKLGLKRASISRFYGEGSADDAEIIRWDDRGRGRKRARAYAHAVVAAEGGEGLETLKRLDFLEVERGTSAVRLAHRTVKSRTLASLARRLLGGSMGQCFPSTKASAFTGPLPVSEAAALDIAQRLSSPVGREIASLCGLTLRSDVEEQPMRLASAILAACGLKMRGERIKAGPRRDERDYFVDLDDLAELQARSQVYLDALRSGKIASGSGDEGDAPAAPKAAPVQAEIVDLDRYRRFEARILEQGRLLDEAVDELYGT